MHLVAYALVDSSNRILIREVSPEKLQAAVKRSYTSALGLSVTSNYSMAEYMSTKRIVKIYYEEVSE